MFDGIGVDPGIGNWPSRLREILPQADPLIDGARGRQVVGAVIDHFRDNLGDPLTLKDLAEEMGCSTFGIIRAFRRLTGITPMRYLSILRLAEAKTLLLTSDVSVITICYEVGYESLGSFNNRFKALVGLTPTGLRRLRDGLDPDALLAACRYAPGAEPQLQATAYFKAGHAYARLDALLRSAAFDPPNAGSAAVVFAIPWSGDVHDLLLPGTVLRSEPVERDPAATATPFPRAPLRPSTRFDPPVLPVIAAARGEPATPRLAATG